MAAIFSDDFNGSGSLSGRAPDTGYGGLNWVADPLVMVVGGALANDTLGYGTTATFGAFSGAYGNPEKFEIAFTLTAPSGQVDPVHSVFRLMVKAGLVAALTVRFNTSTFELQINNEDYVDNVSAPFVFSPGVAYSGVMTVDAGVFSVDIFGVALNTTDNSVAPGGLSQVSVGVPVGRSLEAIEVRDIPPLTFWTQRIGCSEV